jgi:hypothetical protein
VTDGEEGRDGPGVLATGICTSLPAACAQGNEHDAESTETTYRCPLSDCVNSIHLICVVERKLCLASNSHSFCRAASSGVWQQVILLVVMVLEY